MAPYSFSSLAQIVYTDLVHINSEKTLALDKHDFTVDYSNIGTSPASANLKSTLCPNPVISQRGDPVGSICAACLPSIPGCYLMRLIERVSPRLM